MRKYYVEDRTKTWRVCESEASERKGGGRRRNEGWKNSRVMKGMECEGSHCMNI